MRSVRDPKKISLVSAQDSKDYFLLRDAEALFVPASPKIDAYFLSKAYFINTAERTPFIKKFNNILVLAASNGTAARLDIAKDLSYVELKGETDAIKFTKL
ncbi:hypothetical protein [Flavobacterium davisii]|uniref:Uncharacterized protein n=1 Tax=Flavobacterium columnare TaxID=996 RepID=A0A8G0P8C0_9FLAO|nr:hypothetical protein [Flavobacterium davisii]QYS89819.1 hypothetical protein JJC05_06345 [Flavobacterium davisii]